MSTPSLKPSAQLSCRKSWQRKWGPTGPDPEATQASPDPTASLSNRRLSVRGQIRYVATPPSPSWPAEFDEALKDFIGNSLGVEVLASESEPLVVFLREDQVGVPPQPEWYRNILSLPRSLVDLAVAANKKWPGKGTAFFSGMVLDGLLWQKILGGDLRENAFFQERVKAKLAALQLAVVPRAALNTAKEFSRPFPYLPGPEMTPTTSELAPREEGLALGKHTQLIPILEDPAGNMASEHLRDIDGLRALAPFHFGRGTPEELAVEAALVTILRTPASEFDQIPPGINALWQKYFAGRGSPIPPPSPDTPNEDEQPLSEPERLSRAESTLQNRPASFENLTQVAVKERVSVFSLGRTLSGQRDLTVTDLHQTRVAGQLAEAPENPSWRDLFQSRDHPLDLLREDGILHFNLLGQARMSEEALMDWEDLMRGHLLWYPAKEGADRERPYLVYLGPEKRRIRFIFDGAEGVMYHFTKQGEVQTVSDQDLGDVVLSILAEIFPEARFPEGANQNLFEAHEDPGGDWETNIQDLLREWGISGVAKKERAQLAEELSYLAELMNMKRLPFWDGEEAEVTENVEHGEENSADGSPQTAPRPLSWPELFYKIYSHDDGETFIITSIIIAGIIAIVVLGGMQDPAPPNPPSPEIQQIEAEIPVSTESPTQEVLRILNLNTETWGVGTAAGLSTFENFPGSKELEFLVLRHFFEDLSDETIEKGINLGNAAFYNQESGPIKHTSQEAFIFLGPSFVSQGPITVKGRVYVHPQAKVQHQLVAQDVYLGYGTDPNGAPLQPIQGPLRYAGRVFYEEGFRFGEGDAQKIDMGQVIFPAQIGKRVIVSDVKSAPDGGLALTTQRTPWHRIGKPPPGFTSI